MTSLINLSATYNIVVLPEDTIVKQPTIGDKYHLCWASNPGMVWVLHSVQNDMVTLKTPRTKKTLITKITDLREINKNVVKNARKRNAPKYAKWD